MAEEQKISANDYFQHNRNVFEERFPEDNIQGDVSYLIYKSNGGSGGGSTNIKLDYKNTLVVAKDGKSADFTTIGGALASLGTPSSADRYLIKVYPGTYEESITMQSYVDVVAVGSYKDTEILGTTATVVTGASNCSLKGFKVVIANAATSTPVILTNGMKVRDCFVTITSGSSVSSPSYQVDGGSYDCFGYIDSTAAQIGCKIQIFKTASDCYEISSFQIKGTSTATVNYRVSIMPLTTQVASGTPATGNYSDMDALYTYTGVSATDFPSTNWKTYTPSSAIDVLPNTYYAIVVESLHTEAGGIWYGLNWRKGTTSLYEGYHGTGNISEATGKLTSWSMSDATYDFDFIISYSSAEDADVIGITCNGLTTLENNEIITSTGIQVTSGTIYSYNNKLYTYTIGYDINAGTVYSMGNRFTGDGTETDIDIASGATVEYAYDQFDTIANA